MWGNKFSRINKELIIDRMGKKPYDKELTNLFLAKVDMETTFAHHMLPDAMAYLVSLFGEIRSNDSIWQNLAILKKFYREGERYQGDYIKYLDDLGVSNDHEVFLENFVSDPTNCHGRDGDYVRKTIMVYRKYSRTSLLRIIKLEDQLAILEKQMDEENQQEKEMSDSLEINVPSKKKGISKVLDYFRR